MSRSQSPGPASAPPSIDAEDFRDACAQFATGVAVATVRSVDGAPHGLTVNSFTSVSLGPPLVLICIHHTCTAIQHFRLCTFFAVNVLSDEQRHLSVSFSIKPEGRFQDVEWYEGATGAPLLANTLARFECRLFRAITAGDHDVFVGEPWINQPTPDLPCFTLIVPTGRYGNVYNLTGRSAFVNLLKTYTCDLVSQLLPSGQENRYARGLRSQSGRSAFGRRQPW